MPMPNIVSRAGQLAGKASRFAGRVAVKGAKAGGNLIYEHSGLKDKVESVKNAGNWIKRQWNGPSPDDDNGPDRNERESDRRDRSRFERERRSQSDRSTNDAAGERSRQSNDLGQRPLAQLLTRILTTLEGLREDMRKKVQGAGGDSPGLLSQILSGGLSALLMNPATWAAAAGAITSALGLALPALAVSAAGAAGAAIGTAIRKVSMPDADKDPEEQAAAKAEHQAKLDQLAKENDAERSKPESTFSRVFGLRENQEYRADKAGASLDDAKAQLEEIQKNRQESMKEGPSLLGFAKDLLWDQSNLKAAENRVKELEEEIAAQGTKEQRQRYLDPTLEQHQKKLEDKKKDLEALKAKPPTEDTQSEIFRKQEEIKATKTAIRAKGGTVTEEPEPTLKGSNVTETELTERIQQRFTKEHPQERLSEDEAKLQAAKIRYSLTTGDKSALEPDQIENLTYAETKRTEIDAKRKEREKAALEAKPVAQVIPADRLKEEQNILKQGQLTASATPSRGAMSDTEGVNAANPSDRKSMAGERYQNLRTETLKKAVSEGRSDLTPEETQRLDAAYAESHPNTFGDSDLLVNKKMSMEKEIIRARLQQKKPEGDIQSERTSAGYSDQRSEPGTVTPIPRSQQVQTDEMETDEAYLSPLSKESKQEYDPLSIPTVAEMYDDRDKADAFVNALNEGKPLSPEHQALAEKYGVRTKGTTELEPASRPSDVSLNKKDERVPGVTPPIDVRVMNKTSEPIPVWLAEVPTVTSESKTTSTPGTTKTTPSAATPGATTPTAGTPGPVIPGVTTPGTLSASAPSAAIPGATTPGFEKVPRAAEQEYKRLSEDELADLKKNVNYKSGSTKFEEGIGGMSASTQRKFYEMAKEYKEATGESLNVSSAYRSAETQQKLSGGKSSASIAAAGSSQHQHGYAMDIDYQKPAGVGGDLTKDEYSPQMAKLREMGLLEKYGFQAGKDSKAKEAWHLDDKNSLTYKKGSEEAKIAREMSLAGKSGYEIDQALRERKGLTAATSEIKPTTAATPDLNPTTTDSTAAPTMTRVKGKSFDSNVEGAISSASKETGVPVEYMRTMAQIESSGKADAHRTGSKYTGLYQFDEATAKGVGVTDRNDAGQAALGAAKLAQQNVDALKKRGIEVDLAKNPELAYLAHQQGAAGASQIIKAAQSGGPVSERLRKTMDANGGKGMDPKQFLSHWKETYQKKAEQVGYKYDSKGEMIADSKPKPEIPAAPTAETKPSAFKREPTVASKMEPTTPAQPELNAALQEQTVSGKLASNPVPAESKPSLFTQPVEPSPLFQNLLDPSGAQLARASFTSESQPSSYSKMSNAVEEGTYDNIKSEQPSSAPIVVNTGGGGGRGAPQGDGGTKVGQMSQMTVRNNDSAIQLLTAGFLSYGMA